MINSTSRAAYSFSTNAYVDEAYLITDPASQWGTFVVEKGEGQFAGGVRIRNAFNNRRLTSTGGADPTFVECSKSNADQASLISHIIRRNECADLDGFPLSVFLARRSGACEASSKKHQALKAEQLVSAAGG